MARMARSSVSLVTVQELRFSSEIGPIARVMAESPHQPLRRQPVSTETMSPSLERPAVGDAVDDRVVDGWRR